MNHLDDFKFNENFSPQVEQEVYEKERMKYKHLKHELIYKGMTFTQKERDANLFFKTLCNEFRSHLKPEFYHEYTMKHKDQIQNTEIFKIIRRMPKGVTHHMHFDCCFHFSWLFGILINEPRVYIKLNTFEFLLKTAKTKESELEGFQHFQAVASQMNAQELVAMRNKLHYTFTLGIQDVISESESAWNIFEKKLEKLFPLLFYVDIYKQYAVNVMRDFANDGVMHIEGRMLQNFIFDANGDLIGKEKEIALFREAIQTTQKEFPKFTMKLIIQGLKSQQNNENNMKLASDIFDLLIVNNDLIKGFDLVQEEDANRPLKQFQPLFQKIRKLEDEKNMKIEYVFHAGESLKLSNDNLYDAIMLHSKRIGHGLNIIKHSYLFDQMRKKNICIECCPISNQILQYTYDLRIHPLTTYFNYGIPVSISSDDPGFFGVRGVSYDFFVVAISMEFSLLQLKRLCLYSLQCSLSSEQEIEENIKNWEIDWQKFIDGMATQYGL